MTDPNLHRLPEDLTDILASYGTLVSYSDGEQIHARGDTKPGLSIVNTGFVKVGNYGKDGKYCLTRILSPGETFGEFTLFAHLPRTHNAEAIGFTEVVQVEQVAFERCSKKHPELKDALLTSLAVKLHESLEILDDLRRLPLPVRVAKSLLTVSKQRQTSRISITQPALADLLGVTVLSVHHALKTLNDRDLVKLGYGFIEISAPEDIAQWIAEHESLAPVASRPG